MPQNTLLDFFREAPLPEVDLDTERTDDLGRDIVCCADQADYVKSAFKKHVEDEETSIVKEWSVRLFSEDE